MKRIVFVLISCFLLSGLIPVTASAADAKEPFSSEFSRIMDITDSLTKEDIADLDRISMDFLRDYHLDIAIAAIPESRLEGQSVEEFARGLYESCDFGYGDEKSGFMCVYIEDTEKLTVVPMGGAVDVLSRDYLDFVGERAAAFREKYDVYGVVYGCQRFITTEFEKEPETTDTVTETTAPAPVTEPEKVPDKAAGDGKFERCGEGSDKPAWFPKNLDEAYVYFDADASRVVDYADVISEENENKLKERISELSEEIGIDMVVVTDVSDYGLGIDIYAADFYDYNGYGIGEEHEGIVLYLNLDPENRSVWTAETGSLTRGVMTEKVANRLDDFLFATLRTEDYELAISDWVEDVYDVFTVGIARPPFWYKSEEKIPEKYRDPSAPVVVDEWEILTDEQESTLFECSRTLKDKFGLNVYFHTTGDRLGIGKDKYNELYMKSMGYEEDAILFSVENTDGNTVQYSYMYTYGGTKEKIPERFHSRIENNASAASNGYGRLLEGQRLLSCYMENGRVPRNGFYWGMIAVLSTVVGLIVGGVALARANSSMQTVSRQTTAHSYLDRSKTNSWRINETFLFMTTSRVYIPPKDTGSSGSGSSGSSSRSYSSSYSGHSGTSHSGHGGRF